METIETRAPSESTEDGKKEKEKPLEGLVEKEKGLAVFFRDKMAGLLRGTETFFWKNRHLLVVTNVALQLFNMETSSAGQKVEELKTKEVVETQLIEDVDSAEIPTEDLKALNDFLKSGWWISPRFETSQFAAIGYGCENTEARENFFSVDESLDSVVFSRNLSVEEIEAKVKNDSGWKLSSDVWGRNVSTKSYVDLFGNNISTFFRWNNDDVSGEQIIYVIVDPAFSDSIDGESKLAPVRVDFSYIGFPELGIVAYQKRLEQVADFNGVPVYAKHTEFGERFLAFHESFQSGFEQTFDDYGLVPSSVVDRILIRDNTELDSSRGITGVEKPGKWGGMANIWQKEKTLDLSESELEMSESYKPSAEWLEELADHEALHFVGQVTGVHNRLEWERQFLLGTNDVLLEINILDRGGHVQDNRIELFATILNSVDDPALIKKISQLTPEARDYYFESLTVVKDLLLEKGISPRSEAIRNINRVLALELENSWI
jgi:hypothetical protein